MLLACQLLLDRWFLIPWWYEDTMSIVIKGVRKSIFDYDVLQKAEVSFGILSITEKCMNYFAGGIIYSSDQSQLRPPAFQPIVMAGIDLKEQSFLVPTLTP
jgi:hypothetical protein